MTVIVGNRQLATQARELAAQAPLGSLERKAAGCLSVALGETRTAAAARQVLDTIEDADIRSRAGEILTSLLERENTGWGKVTRHLGGATAPSGRCRL